MEGRMNRIRMLERFVRRPFSCRPRSCAWMLAVTAASATFGFAQTPDPVKLVRAASYNDLHGGGHGHPFR